MGKPNFLQLKQQMDAGEARQEQREETGKGIEPETAETSSTTPSVTVNKETKPRASRPSTPPPAADEPLTVRKTLPISATHAMAITALQELRDAGKRKTTEAQIIHEALTMYFRDHAEGISAMKLAKLKMEFLS